MKFLLSTVTLLTLSVSTYSQSGMVTYTVTPVDQVSDAKERAKLPTSLVYSVSGRKTRSDWKGGALPVSLLIDHAADKAVRIEGKDVMEVDSAERASFVDNEVRDIKVLEEKKSLAGISCNRITGIVYHPSSDFVDEADFWIAGSVNLFLSPDLGFSGMKGFPMEFDLVRDGQKLHLVASKVELKEIDAKVMTFPAVNKKNPDLSMPLNIQDPKDVKEVK